MNYQYFEIYVGPGSAECANDYWVCIRGIRTPTIEEAEQFCSEDMSLHGCHVLGVCPIDRESARDSYDFSREHDWPVFGCPEHHA